MASLIGERVGHTVGLVTRDDREVSAATRLIVMTEGVLTSESIRRQNLGAPIILQLGDSNTLSGGRYNGVSLMIKYAYNPKRQRRHFKTASDMAQFAAWLHQVAQLEPDAVQQQPDPVPPALSAAERVDNWPVARTQRTAAVERDLTLFTDRPAITIDDDGMAWA